jgi:hypothetical protein
MMEQLLFAGLLAPVSDHRRTSAAEQIVVQALSSILPPGVPLPVTRVVDARRARGVVTATVEFWDGRQGQVRIGKWHPDYADAWTVEWLGGARYAASWNGAAWERIEEVAS